MADHINELVKSIGIGTVERYLPRGMKLGYCDMHGHYLKHYTSDGICPQCIGHDPKSDGTTASDMEHYIEIRQALGMDGINPQQKNNPYGV